MWLVELKLINNDSNSCFSSTSHPGCQWQMKVYLDSLLKMYKNVIILGVTVTGWGVRFML